MPDMASTLPMEPGSKVSLTAREAPIFAWSLPASVVSLSAKARMSPDCTSWTMAMPQAEWYLFSLSLSTFSVYHCTSRSMVRVTSDPLTASLDSVMVPGISTPLLPCWYTW